jgi:hypothetical protein
MVNTLTTNLDLNRSVLEILYLFIYLFADALNDSERKAFSGRIMNRKVVEGSGRGLTETNVLAFSYNDYGLLQVPRI